MQVLQTLTLAEVKAKAREFYAAKKLTAQHHDPDKRVCVNDGEDGYRCAVAAAFNDELLAHYPTGSIGRAARDGLVGIPHNEIHLISDIQNAHDDWATRAQDGSPLAGGFERRFVALIQE